VPSICRLIPSAVVFERELREMFGIAVIGIPNADPLFLPDGWAEEVYPLRKDATLE
jgi:Ni,Fe-hydrogenase III component G